MRHAKSIRYNQAKFFQNDDQPAAVARDQSFGLELPHNYGHMLARSAYELTELMETAQRRKSRKSGPALPMSTCFTPKGDVDQLVGKIQERTGEQKEAIRKTLDRMMESEDRT